MTYKVVLGNNSGSEKGGVKGRKSNRKHSISPKKMLRSISQIKRTLHRMTGGIFNLIKVSGHLNSLQAKKLIIEGSRSSHRHKAEERKKQVTEEM